MTPRPDSPQRPPHKPPAFLYWLGNAAMLLMAFRLAAPIWFALRFATGDTWSKATSVTMYVCLIIIWLGIFRLTILLLRTIARRLSR